MIPHADILKKNLPDGQIWQVETDPLLSHIIANLGSTLDAAQTRINQLKFEMSPLTANDLLADWEADAGIPDYCFPLAKTDDERGFVLRRKILERQPTTKAGIGAELAKIDIALSDARGQCTVTLPATNKIYARCARSRCGNDRLLQYSSGEHVKCWLKRILPAHIFIKFKAKI